MLTNRPTFCSFGALWGSLWEANFWGVPAAFAFQAVSRFGRATVLHFWGVPVAFVFQAVSRFGRAIVS